MKIRSVFDREVDACFHTLYGYAFTAFVLLAGGIYTTAVCLQGGSAQFSGVLRNMTFIFLIVIPILTMRVFADERRQKTEQLLYALPVRMAEVVLGKFLALAAVIALPVLIMALYPLVLGRFGTVDYPAAYCALLGFYLLGLCLGAIGMFLSAQTDSLAAAAGMSFAVTLLLFFLSTLSELVSSSPSATLLAAAVLLALVGLAAYSLTKSRIFSLGLTVGLEAVLGVCYLLWKDAFFGLFPALMRRLSVFDRYYVFLDGIFDWTGVVYLLSAAAFFLLLTGLTLEKRRWSE